MTDKAPPRRAGINAGKRPRKPSKEDAEAFMYAALIDCHIDLAQEWAGWKIRGRDLVDPTGVRLSVARLRYLMFREESAQRRDRAHLREGRSSETNVVRLPLLPRDHVA